MCVNLMLLLLLLRDAVPVWERSRTNQVWVGGELPALGETHWTGSNNIQVCFVLAAVSTAQYIRDRFGADAKVTIGAGMRRE